MDRERERKIVEQGRTQGKSDEFIKQAIIRDRQSRQPVQPSVMPQPVQEQRGFFESLVKRPVERLVLEPARRTGETIGLGIAKLAGASPEQMQRGIESTQKDKTIAGFTLRGQKPLGEGGGKQILGEGFETASYLYGGGKAPNILSNTLKGQMLKTAVPSVKAGFVGSGAYGAGDVLQQGGTFAEAGKSGLFSALAGGAGGLAFGIGAPLLSKGLVTTKNLITQKGRQELAESTMNKVARINPTDYNKFKKTTGKDVGEYLVERGIYGNDEEVARKLFDDSMRSKNIVDQEFEKMGGNWKDASLKDALDLLAQREAQVSSPNIKSPDFNRVQQLIQKHNTDGLTMPEINEAKRLFERNVKLDYLRANIPTNVAQANNIDNAIRQFQFSTAKKLGLENLPELNKNTQASYMLANALYKKMTGQSGNNFVGLGDLVLLSGGDIRNVAMAGARGFFGNKTVQSKFAQSIAPTKGTSVMPKTRAPITAPQQMLPEPSFIPMGGKVLQDMSGVQSVPAQRNLVTTNPQTGKFQRTFNSAPTEGSAKTIPPQPERIKPLLISSLPKNKPQPTTPSTNLSTKANQPVSSANSTTLGGKAKDWYKRNLGDEKGAINVGAMADDLKGSNLASQAKKMKAEGKYKNTLNLQDKNDLEELGRIFSRDAIEDMKNGKMINWRGTSYEEIGRVNILNEKPMSVAEKLEGKIKEIKLPTNTFYHGTSADSARSITQSGFRTGASLPEDAFRGGGYGRMQNSISLAETPKKASIFSNLTRNGEIVEVKLKDNSKVVSIDGIEDAIDLEDFIPYLKKQKVDAVYIGGGEKELVVLDPKSLVLTSKNNGVIPKLKQAGKQFMEDMKNEDGFVKNPFSGKNINSIDAPTKKELLDLQEYLRKGEYNRRMEGMLYAFGDKFGIPIDKSKQVQINYITKLLDKTKTTETLPGTNTRKRP